MFAILKDLDRKDYFQGIVFQKCC